MSLALADVPFSPLVLADRLINLAQAADQAGYTARASKLVVTAYAVLDDRARCPEIRPLYRR